MDSILQQLKTLAGAADEGARQKLVVALRDISYSIESPDDTMQRLYGYNLQVAAVRIGIDTKLFEILASNDGSLTVDELSSKTKAERSLVGRLLRYYSSQGMIKETGKDQFKSNGITKTLGDPKNHTGIFHYFDFVGPVYQELPAFLRKTSFRDVTDNKITAFQDAYKTTETVFEFFPKRPEEWNNFNKHMAARREGMPTWLSVYPIKKNTAGWSPELPVFVDIGGGIGHQCAELKAKYPELPGRVILEDLPHCIDQAIKAPGVEAIVHNFFEPQPIKGAKFYYLRGILHDFPDEKCQLILKNCIDALGKDSVILIDEMVLPNTNVYWQTTQIDLTMMSSLAARERTHEHWVALLESANLKVVDIHVYTPSVYESVITCVPK